MSWLVKLYRWNLDATFSIRFQSSPDTTVRVNESSGAVPNEDAVASKLTAELPN